jgi:mRNA-degrading endonuclease toxin of MazEF toxin-antitoxin module
VRKGGGFKKSKAARTGLATCNRIKSPKKEIIKRRRLTKKNQNQTEKCCTQRNL